MGSSEDERGLSKPLLEVIHKLRTKLFTGTSSHEAEKIRALWDDGMVELSEESNSRTIRSLKKRKKKTTKPSLSRPWPITLLKVKEEKIERWMTEHNKKEKDLYNAKVKADAVARGSRGQALVSNSKRRQKKPGS